MSFSLKTNMESLVAQNHLKKNQKELAKNVERLSSGRRITSASDDAAGIATLGIMEVKIKTLTQNKRNINDGISLLQTAEGSLNSISTILIRMRELTIQAASDTLDEKSRQLLNKEFVEIAKEANRIHAQTEFQNLSIFDTKLEKDTNIHIQSTLFNHDIVKNEENNIVLRFEEREDLYESLCDLLELNIEGEDSEDLGGSTEDVFKTIDHAINTVNSVRASFGAMQSRINSTLNVLEVAKENFTAAQSHIRDVDYGLETAKFAQNKILVTAGTSILAQANQIPENVKYLIN